MINNSIKLVLALLLFLCLLEMPYGYYQLVRFLSFSCFAFFAYQSLRNVKINEGIIFIILALLFQPFLKIALGREIWNYVDIIVGLSLIASVFYKSNKKD
jgi:hypothetical protein